MSDLHDKFEKLLADQPDNYTLAWWRSQFEEVKAGYRGASHAINRSLADYEDMSEHVAELRRTVSKLEAELEADRAKIGEMSARIDRMAEFLTKLKKQNACTVSET